MAQYTGLLNQMMPQQPLQQMQQQAPVMQPNRVNPLNAQQQPQGLLSQQLPQPMMAAEQVNNAQVQEGPAQINFDGLQEKLTALYDFAAMTRPQQQAPAPAPVQTRQVQVKPYQSQSLVPSLRGLL